MTYLDKKWQLRLFYTTTPAGLTLASHEHNLYVNVTAGVDPGGDMSDFEVTARNGTFFDLETWIDSYMDLVEPLFADTAQFIRMELWGAEPLTEDYIFYSVLPIGHAGSNVTAMRPYVQQAITYRCANGNNMRSQFMETSLTEGAKDPYPFANAPSAALAAFVSGLASPIVNKRGSFPIAPINNCVEQNETLWDKRNGR